MNKSDLSPIEDRVEKALQSSFPDSPSPRLIIGVSGGPDSMCLLYVLHKLNAGGLVVHINYGKRGEESDKDAELVEQMAFLWGFDCHSLSVDPGDAKGENFQQWARSIRYDIFRALASEHKAEGIAVAHHQDDQVETILQKLFRGAGLAYWSGMSIWDGSIFRPLLHTSRSEIEGYLEKESIPYRTDRSNLRSEFARNFLRNEWLRELETHFPGWRKNVLRIAEQAKLFEEALESITQQLGDNGKGLSREGLLKYSPRLQKALVLHELKKIQPGIQVGGDSLDELDSLTQLQTGKAIQLSKEFSLMRDRDFFRLVSHSDRAPLQRIELDRSRLENDPFEFEGLVFEINDFSRPDYDHRLYLDADKMDWPLKLRRWKKGDRFKPYGMEGHQNVSDHLTNRKISAARKDKALVLESFEEIICAVIFPPSEQRVPPGTISELVSCEASTGKCLTVKKVG